MRIAHTEWLDERPGWQKAAIALEIFVGLSALAGGYGLVSDAEALGMERAWLDGSPFESYTVPGLFLLIVIGGGMLGAAALAISRSPAAPIAALAMGTVLLVWLVIETAIVGYVGYEQLLMVALYGAAGAALAAAAALSFRRSPGEASRNSTPGQ